MKTLIFSHHDADGVLSSRILERALSQPGDIVDVRYQNWSDFGVHEKDIELFSKYDTIFVTDLGTTKENLEVLSKISKEKNVYLIDHHPVEDSLDNYTSPNFSIINRQDNCSGGLAYLFVKEIGKADDISLWYATMAVYSDVVYELEGGKQIIQEAYQKGLPLLYNIVYFDGVKEMQIPQASLYGSYINGARRVAYNYGPIVSLNALKELEENGDLSIIVDNMTEEQEAMMPHVALLKTWQQRWLQRRSEALKQDVAKTVELTGKIHLLITFTDHPYDVAGYVAGVKSRSGNSIAINYGVPDGTYANLSGRVNENEKIDLNLLMSILNELTEGLISGGGHPEAVGGKVSRALTRQQVISFFDKAIRIMGGDI